jgi:hypothetical protein
MKRLPTRRVIESAPAQKEMLARWLHEWQIEKALSSGKSEKKPPVRDPEIAVASGSGSEDAVLQVGQVRLFQPFCKGAAARPRYFAVLALASEGGVLIAPFARFSTPAVPGEWGTGLSPAPLRVLCVWNARATSAQTVRRSWVVEHLSRHAQESACLLIGHVFAGAPVPATLAEQVGPPIRHPLDPRHEYVDQERAWISGMPGVAPSRDLSAFGFGENRQNLPLAAEHREEYRTSQDELGGRKPDRPDKT